MPRLKLSTIPKSLSTHLFSPTTPTTTALTATTAPTTSFQILSDLHLEATQTPPNTYETFHIPPRAPYLLLAGDIGLLTPSHYPRYLHFLTAHVHKFRQIFLTLGNHEFYHQTRDEALRAASRLESERALEGRVKVLYRREAEEEVICVLGATLNTHVPEEAAAEVAARVQDFKMIRGWSVDAHNRAFREDVEWLKTAVAGLRGRKAVIVTHHAPRVGGTSKRVFEGSSLASAFATDVVGEVLAAGGGGGGGEGVGTWVFGHTHFSVDFWVKWKRGRVRLVANQRGYFGEEEAGFDIGLVVGV
ncbi:Metallo-dependent phosphatase-like protein [Tuber brumale]|nr:Metallo-dependent phosphatase-like protein [Tuber brumale]